MSAVAPYHGPSSAPAVTTEHDFGQIVRMSQALKNSGLIPTALRGKPDDIALVALRGLELGLSFTQSFAHLHPVHGNIITSAKLQLGLVRQAGHMVSFEESTHERCTAVGTRRDTGEVQSATWTIEEARAVSVREDGKWIPLASKAVWKSFPTDMLRARAITRLVTMLFSDVTLGLECSPEEQTAIEGAEIADVQVDDPIDAKALEAPAAEVTTSPTPEPPAGADPEAEHHNECTRIAGAMGRIPTGLWRQQWVKAWNKAGLPSSAHDLADEQLEPARCLIRQYIALAELDGVGLKAPDERHAFIMAATDGATQSTKQLTHEQFNAVVRAIQRLKAETAPEPEPPPEEPPDQGSFEQVPAHAGDPF